MKFLNFKRMKLGKKMIVAIFGVTVIALFFLVMIIIVQVRRIQTATSLESARNLTEVYTATVKENLEKSLVAARILAQGMSHPESIPVESRRGFYKNLVESVAVANPHFFGIWMTWEPNALDGLDKRYANKVGYDSSGRFDIYYYWEKNELKSMMGSTLSDLSGGSAAYYQIPVDTGKESILEPYIDEATGRPILMTSLSVPIVREGKVLGVVGVDITLENFQTFVSSIKPYGTGVAALFSNSGIVTAHFDPSHIGKQMRESERAMSGEFTDDYADAVKEGRQKEFSVYSPDMGTDIYIIGTPFFIGETGRSWLFTVGIPMNKVLASVNSLSWFIILFSIFISVVIFVAVILISRSISVPIGIAVAKTEEIASGDLSTDVPQKFLDRGDEIGQLAQALQNMISHLRIVIGEVVGASQQVSDGSNQLSSTSQQMSQGASEQASSLEEISSSMEEMTSNIRQNAENSIQTEQIARKSAFMAEDGGKAVFETVEAMRLISSKISIIEEIARSTNMLSLNASIEAARAGEYGKGFAVVASEVGKLAERSQREAGEISKLSLESVSIAERAGKTIALVIPEIKRTAELVQEISAASNEQNSGAEQINSAIMQLDKVVQQNASVSEESASMAEELSSQSGQLQTSIDYFKIDSADGRKKNGHSEKGKTPGTQDASLRLTD